MKTYHAVKYMDLVVALVAVLAAALPAVAAQAATPPPPAPPIRQVVVYADRAEVTRRAPAPCPQGKVEVAFPGLPTGLDVRTLRAEATGRARVLGTTHRIQPLEQERDARAAELLAEHDRLTAARQELLGAHRDLVARLSGLTAYGSYFATLAGEEARGERPDTARWGRALELMTGERLAAAAVEVEQARKLRQLDRQVELVNRRLDHLAPDRVAEALNVTVAVDCQGEAQPVVALSYVVPGATWHAEYDLRFVADGQARLGKGQAELTVAAVVQQSSGEDWDDVQLTLSTARPRLGAEAPLPAPLLVQGGPAGKKKVLVAALEKRAKLDEGGAAAAPAQAVQAAIEDRGQSFVLILPHRTTIHADGRPYWMPVDVLTAAAEARLVTVPKLRPYVYQVARLKNPASYPLLAGRVHSYRGGSYVGDTALEYKGPGEPLEVSLGVDEELRVERKEVEVKDRGAGFLSSTKHLQRAYRIRLSSGAKVAVPVELRENLPVSKTAEVKVELVRGATTAGFDLDAERGILSWSLPVAPGKEAAVDLAYVIHLPEDWDVQLR